MAEITAYADTFRDWEGLIGTIAENAALVPGNEPFVAVLQATLTKAKEIKVQQESLAGNRLAMTESFLRQVDAGKDQARKLRSFIVSVLGPRSPYLSLFGIPPKPERKIVVRRRRKAKQSPAPTESTEEKVCGSGLSRAGRSSPPPG
jgi:hypothetical protein